VNREQTTGAGHMVLQVGHHIIMTDRMAQSGALPVDGITTVAAYGDTHVNREQTTGAGHNGVASGTRYHNGRQDRSIRCTTNRCNNHISRLWRRTYEPKVDNGCRAHGLLQVEQHIIMSDRMAQAGALQTDVTTTLADYGDTQVNREQTTGAGHTGVASGTPSHNDRQDDSIRCTTNRCNNHSSRLWRRAG
jgi:hypothetical protein